MHGPLSVSRVVNLKLNLLLLCAAQRARAMFVDLAVGDEQAVNLTPGALTPMTDGEPSRCVSQWPN